MESWELSSLVHKLDSMHSHLVGLLAACHKHIGELTMANTILSMVDAAFT